MKAIDARNQSDDKHADLVKQQMKRIVKEINAAIKKAQYEVMMYETLYPENIDRLQDDGFQVFRRGGRLGDRNHLIQWNAAKGDPETDTDGNVYYPAISSYNPPL